MALVNNGTMMSDNSPSKNTPSDNTPSPSPTSAKKVFLVATFAAEGGTGGPARGTAEQVVAVIGMAEDQQRFEWIGNDQQDSVTNPALVTPVEVPMALPSPWHDADDGMVTGLVQLAPEQLGDGPVDDDLDHLLSALAASRRLDRQRRPEVG